MEEKTVLVIEDDRSIARLTEVMLNGKGIKTHLCLDASHSLEMARRVGPDLIILDIHMPRRSGIGVLKKLRQDESTRKTPVIISSILSRRQSIEQLKKMGADDFVPKSKGINALIDKVLYYLESGTEEGRMSSIGGARVGGNGGDSEASEHKGISG
jgi:CheY-like chemotaxis protein